MVLLAIGIVSAAGLVLLGCMAGLSFGYMLREPWLYSGESIEGRVVDGIGGEPLPGVAVVAIWEMYVSDTPSVLFHIDEARTDSDGRYRVAAWGPKLRWPPWNGMSEAQPQLIFFKPQYLFEMRSNRAKPGGRGGVRRSAWSGHDIELLKASGRDRYAASLYELAPRVDELIRENCDWEPASGFIELFVDEVQAVGREGLWRGSMPMEGWGQIARQAGCSRSDSFGGDEQ